jgi:hypothetical protein
MVKAGRRVGQRWLQRRSLIGGLPFAVLGGRVNFLSFLFLFFTNLQKYTLIVLQLEDIYDSDTISKHSFDF